MSRFFARDSDTESDSSSSEEEMAPRAGPQTKAPMAWSSDEEDTKRVVRSEKDKRYDELKDIIKKLKNHKKIKDMCKCLSEFETLGKAYEKARRVVESDGIPKFYLGTLCELEDFINECWDDTDGRKKTMSKANARGLTTLRQKLKRYIRDNELQEQLNGYREKPEEDEEEPEQKDDSDDDVEFGAKKTLNDVPKIASFGKDAPAEASDSESDDEWPSDTDSSSSEDEEKYTGQLTAEFFLKKKTDDSEELERKRREREKEKEKRRERDRERKEAEAAEDKADGWTTVTGGIPGQAQPKAKLFPDDAEITVELVSKKLLEILSGRGKKGTDRNEQIELLTDLRNISVANTLGPAMEAKVLFNIVAAIFDYNPNISTCMKPEVWEKTLVNIQGLLDLLCEHRGKMFVGTNVIDESEVLDGEGPWRVKGCILAHVERFDEEFTKMLQACDAHATEYVERLRDEKKVCSIILQLEGYLEGNATSEELCRVYLKHIEHLYYKFERNTPASTDGAVNGTPPTVESGESTLETMERLTKYIFKKDSTDRLRTRATLCSIYYHAIHDRFFEARDLMLMSHLQDAIQHADIPMQIMYNRAMVQLGLCAFRQQKTKDAHDCLVDIQSSGRAKELLAQGLLLQRQYERTPEQEKMEKRRQMPYHMHINLEMLECVYLVSAMLIEIPYMAAHEFDARRRMISKNFHHVMRVSERQLLVGPPESMREHVVAASKAMKKGDWKACINFIINDKMNAKVWDLFHEPKRIREQLVGNIKEESLRTYLFTYSRTYESMSLDRMSEMFDLGRGTVHSVFSKMIINEELMGSLDEPSQCVVMHRTEPTRLQSLALQLSEKASSLVDFNERMLEAKQGGGFFSYQRGGGERGGYRGGRGGGEGHEGRGGGRGGGGYHDRENNYRGGRGGGGGYHDRENKGYGGRGGGGYRDNKGYGGRDGEGGGYRGGRGGRGNRGGNRGGYEGGRGGGRGRYQNDDYNNRRNDRYSNTYE